MITIVEGMTPAEFLSAINSNFPINENTILNTMQGDNFNTAFNYNYDYLKDVVSEIPAKTPFTFGSAINFVNTLNQNFQKISDTDTDEDNYVSRFTLRFDITTTTPNKTMGLGFWCGAILAGNAPLIKWGDGEADTVRAISPAYGYDVPQQHEYAVAGTYHVQIQRSCSIIQVLANYTDNFACLVPGSQFLKATPNIEDIYGASAGNFSGLTKLKKLQLHAMTEDYICDLSTLVNIEDLRIYSNPGISCGFYGDMTGLTKMKTMYLGVPAPDDKEYYGNISGWTQIETFEKDGNYVTHTGLTGVLSSLTTLRVFCFSCTLPITIDITNCMDLEYMSGNATILGYGGDKIKMWYGPTGTGPFENLTHLRYLWGGDIKRLNNKPLVEWATFYQAGYSSAEINQLLADLWANKDADHGLDAVNNSVDSGSRFVELGGNSAPTGQGLIDLANLRAYRTPNNDPTKALWTINVNE